MHTVDEVLWEGDWSETLTVQYPASSEAHEEVCALGVAGGPSGNGTVGSLLHGVVVGFVELGVLSELKAEVLHVVDGKASDDLAWAEIPSHRR